MTDRRQSSNGNGNGHYRGESSLTPPLDPTENVRELVALHALRQDDLRKLEAQRQDHLAKQESRRLDERYRIMEKHRGEIEAKDRLIAQKETERINAVAIAEKARVDQNFAEQRAAVALAQTSTDLKAEALRTQVSTTATTLATQTSANSARTGLSTPLLAVLAAAIGGILLYAIEHLTALSPVTPIVVK